MKRSKFRMKDKEVGMKRVGAVVFLIVPFLILGCGPEVDEQAKGDLVEIGYAEEEAADLSRFDLSAEEIEQLEIAKRGGLDGTAAAQVVEVLHEQGLAFDIGMEMQTLSGAGFSATALVELVEMGAVRTWESDLRTMRHSGIGEPTILAIARRKFVDEEEDVLAGRDYVGLKMVGMTDAGIEQFLAAGGTVRQAQEVQQAIRMGESETKALGRIQN